MVLCFYLVHQVNVLAQVVRTGMEQHAVNILAFKNNFNSKSFNLSSRIVSWSIVYK
jgi:thymidine kinase